MVSRGFSGFRQFEVSFEQWLALFRFFFSAAGQYCVFAFADTAATASEILISLAIVGIIHQLCTNGVPSKCLGLSFKVAVFIG